MDLSSDWAVTRRELRREARNLGFEMSSLAEMGAFLAALAASKPAGRVLELGTGIGLGTTWLLQGMSGDSSLVTVEYEPELARRAAARFGSDRRVTVVAGDAGAYLTQAASSGIQFDLIFADAWPGKFSHRSEALSLVSSGGFYVVDDLHSQATWPEGHQTAVDRFLVEITADDRFEWSAMEWASGILIGTRRADLTAG